MKHSELKKIILIGASTGGPGQIEKIIKQLPPLSNTSIIIAQHFAKGFAKSYANRLNRLTQNSISLAENDETLISSHIYICSDNIYIKSTGNQLHFEQKAPAENMYNPDINKLFSSFIPFVNKFNILSVILTGIGEDGVEACNALSLSGSRVITEDSSSAIVDGMPHCAREKIENIEVHNLDNIIKNIKEFCE